MNPLESFYNPLALAKPKQGRSMMASSYDRRGGNHDWSNYLRREGSAAVLLDTDGPGCITRIWTADPQKGTLRVYIDNATEPTIETPFELLFGLLPLSFGIGGESPERYAQSVEENLPMGRTSYCPFPFRTHCKITIDPEDDYLYYQINYDLYTEDESNPVKSFDPKISLHTPEIQLATNSWRDSSNTGNWSDAVIQQHTVARNSAAPIFSQDGPGVILGVRIHLPQLQPGSDPLVAEHLRDNLWLTAHFDDDEPHDPSVRAPIGPLFLDFGQSPSAQTLMVGTDDSTGAYYLRFPMPFHHSARLALVNRTLLNLEDIEVLIVTGPPPPADLLRFRCTWHIETPFGPDHRDYGGVACRILNLDGRDNYEILNVRGAGQFVGCGFQADMRDAPTDRACCEGDEMFFIDDDPRLTLYGTGAEDYVNDAWGLRGYAGRLSGDALTGRWGTDALLTGYRLHLSDAIPFHRRGRFTLEHGTGNNCSGLYRSVAYWYMSPASARTRVEERQWEEARK